jgi:hypothetical protein
MADNAIVGYACSYAWQMTLSQYASTITMDWCGVHEVLKLFDVVFQSDLMYETVDRNFAQ